MIGRVEVGGSRGEGEGRQVGQFEGSLFCTEGPVYGMGGHLFTVISILRVVCCRGIGSRRGRVAHLRTTDDKAKVNRLLSTLSLILSDNPLMSNFIYSASLLPLHLRRRYNPLSFRDCGPHPVKGPQRTINTAIPKLT